MIKNVANISNKDGTEEVHIGILRVDGSHGQPSALLNLVNSGYVITGHKNLKPGKHDQVISFVDGVTGRSIDPRLLEKAPESVIEKKVKDEQAKRA